MGLAARSKRAGGADPAVPSPSREGIAVSRQPRGRKNTEDCRPLGWWAAGAAIAEDPAEVEVPVGAHPLLGLLRS